MAYYIPEKILELLDLARHYRNTHLNGDEKIQEMVKMIEQKYDELVIKDKPIIIRSIELPYYFQVESQLDVLKLLHDKYHCIEYGVHDDAVHNGEVHGWLVDEPVFPMDYEIEGVPSVSDKVVRKRVIENARYYIIKVLPSFSEVIKNIETGARPIYQLRYSEFKGQVYFNDILLSNLQSDSSSRKLLDVAFSSKGNDFIEKSDIDGRTISKILNNLKLSRPLYELFFQITPKGFRFREAVYSHDIKSENINTKLIEKEISNLKDKVKAKIIK